MNPKRFFILIILVSLLLTGLWLPANAAPSAQQQIPTPTAGADGRIIYVVQAGDSCIRVAALNGISQEVLRQLNSTLDENCTLFEGQELLRLDTQCQGRPELPLPHQMLEGFPRSF